MSNIFIVTLTEDYQLIDQFAYHSEQDANTKHNELLKEHYTDAVTWAQGEDYDEEVTLDTYQNSEAWWDCDERMAVHFEKVVLN